MKRLIFALRWNSIKLPGVRIYWNTYVSGLSTGIFHSSEFGVRYLAIQHRAIGQIEFFV